MVKLSTLLIFLLVLQTVLSADPSSVVSGVFMPNAESLDYISSDEMCLSYNNATMSTLEQAMTAYRNGFETCKWGWVKEKMIVMLRLTPNEKCGNYSVGVLMRPCTNYRPSSVLCISENGLTVMQLPWAWLLNTAWLNSRNMSATSITKHAIRMPY
ncbi:hypothetical protein GDO86_017926 [Hymenochirus boettgeri]|uniref:Link domain-containing protein n=1 Tax=Hymenochirus boettgeri TaxID=247094 RepID=A0A8T2IIG6_9PIPI|nr:hypothetical protein GDO86_017926 [Hymenochirus boettgeri]